MSKNSSKNQQIKQNVFIQPLNSLFAHCFIENLSLHKKHQFDIVGKVNKLENESVPECVHKIIDENITKKEMKNLIIGMDLIILEVMKCSVEDLEFIIKIFEDNFFENTKKIVFISHPYMWYQTKEEKSSIILESEIFQKNKNDSKIDNNSSQNITWNSKQFLKRRTLPCYEIKRLIENQFLKMCKQNDTIQGCIILPGIIYGRGEDDLYELFNQCLQGDQLEIYFKGDNMIPMIHVLDLSLSIIKILYSQEYIKEYYILVDNAKITQKQFIIFICDYFQLTMPEIIQSYDVYFKKDFLTRTINLNFENSESWQGNELYIESIYELQKLENNNNRCHDGIIDNFQKVFEDFILYRGIQRKKIILLGDKEIIESIQLKSVLNEKFGFKIYNEENICNLFKDKNYQESDGILYEIQQNILEYQEQKIEEIFQQKIEEQKKNKKKNQEEILKENIIFDPYQNLTSDLLIDILMYYLKLPQSIFQGYLLDGIPKNNEEAHQFLLKIQEQNLREDFDVIIHILPDYETMEEQLKFHQKNMGKDTEHQLTNEQIDYYEKYMNYVNKNEDLIEYFKNNDYRVMEIKFLKQNISTQKIIDFILNEEINEFQDIYIEEQIQSIQNEQDFEQQQQENEEIEQQDIQNEQNSYKSILEELNQEDIYEKEEQQKMLEEIKHLKNQELQKLFNIQKNQMEQKTLALKQYLTDIILPDITEGILEICSQKPEDPIRFLIDYLKQKKETQNK